MIKAIIYYDGQLNDNLCDYLRTDEYISYCFPEYELYYIDGEYGYTSVMEGVEWCASLPTNYIVYTNSLHAFNSDIAKEQCSDANGDLANFYIFCRGSVENINSLTDKRLTKKHNLEKIIINNGLEKL